MKPVLQLALACVRRSPLAFFIMTVFVSVLWVGWLSTEPQTSERASWLGHGPLLMGLLAITVASGAFSLLSETLVALKRQVALPLLPRFAQTIRRFMWLTLLLVLSLWGIPMVWMLGASSMLPVLFTFVASICLGLSVGLVRLSTGSIGASRVALQIFTSLHGLVFLASRGALKDLGDWVIQHPIAAWFGSIGLATVALSIWIWTVRRVVRCLMQPPAEIDEGLSDISPWSRIKTWWEPPLPGSPKRAALLAPGRPASLAILGFTVFYSGVFYFIFALEVNHCKNLGLLVPLPLMLTLSFVVQGLWISPRLLLLPGGLGRRSISWRIYEQIVRAHLPAFVLMMAATTLTLAWACGLPWSHGLVLGLSSVTSLLSLLALVLLVRVVPAAAAHHQACMTVAFMVTVPMGVLQSHYAIAALQDQEANPWFWALLPVLLGLLPTFALLLAIGKPWAQYDWRNMPTSPTQRTIFSWKETSR